ncbi:putative component of type VI protein secretion system [Paraburkholderia sp. GAS32]
MKPGQRTGSHLLSIGRISDIDLTSSRPQTFPETHRRADAVGVCVITLVDDHI